MILDFVKEGKEYKTSEIADVINLSSDRTRVYLKKLVAAGQLKSTGTNKTKVYFLP